ncbi:TetR/AcrR family transcriptional regulator [Actinomadura hibisca]|uniref:TetR/AcrR family transcriptional regulator n=1 Tax=Actinomadura hibisca TaxID=68565 RepID=UPI000829CAA8|nr:TetR/AcrR family transcriptional regulator [Actinomadura hibisca]
MSPYHHGNLRPVLLDAAAAAIEQQGPAALSLRDLARRAGVSHAAPAHHFGDKTGLLTALATQGYELLADALEAAGPDILDTGVAYVRFAVGHRAHFEVMFQPGLYKQDDAEVTAAQTRAGRALHTALAATPEAEGEHANLAAWSIVHGFAALWISGALPEGLGDDAGTAALPVIRRLFT